MTQRTTTLGPGLDRLVERQLRNWELSGSQHFEKRTTNKPIHEFVAISRQADAGGCEVGRLVAAQLGWPMFDKEIIHAMAGDDEYQSRLFESLDEHDVSWLEQMLASILQDRVLQADYFRNLTRTMLTLARVSPTVFVGRGADMVLPANQGLRVRIIAPLEQRVQQYARRNHLDESEAKKAVTKIDRERADFIRNHFHRDIDDPLRCDMTLNMSRLSTQQAADIIVETMHLRGVKPAATRDAAGKQ